MIIFAVLSLFSAQATPIKGVQFFDFRDTLPTVEESESTLHLRWPFCTTYPNSNSCPKKMWVDLEIDIDTYIQRRNDTHDSLFEIMQTSYDDVDPIADGLKTYFRSNNIDDMATKVGTVQGMIQAIHYAYDNCEGDNKKDCKNQDSTGWTEYPKYALEFLFDQKGDCDDAMIASVAILERLSVESWMVDWVGHASTAVTREQGNLKEVKVPKGSRLITPPTGGSPLLSVDSVGALQGCKWGCSPLGWNEWHSEGLKVTNVYRYNDPKLDGWGLRTWKKNGGRFAIEPQDRRKEKREKIIEEINENKDKWEKDTEQRLTKLNVDEEEITEIIKASNPYRRTTDEGWSMILLIFGGLAGGFVVNVIYQKRKRKKLSEKIKKEEEQRSF